MTDTLEELPARIDCLHTLPDGSAVWLKVLNSAQRAAARSAADIATAAEMRVYRPGNPGYDALGDSIDDMSIETQAAFLASVLFITGDGWEQVRQKYPDPERPERGEGMDDSAFIAAQDAWEADCTKAAAQREKYQKTLYDAEVKRATSLTPGVRRSRCIEAERSIRYRQAFVTHWQNEHVSRGTRDAENHTRQIYASAAEVADLDDAIRESLVVAYFALEAVRAADVPTSPGASTD